MATLTLAQALEDVLPYVESRLEDMAEDAETTNPEHRAEARRLYARALLRYRRAQRMLRREWDARIEARMLRRLRAQVLAEDRGCSCSGEAGGRCAFCIATDAEHAR